MRTRVFSLVGPLIEPPVRVGAIRRATTPGTGSRGGCVAARHHKFLIRDPSLRDSNARTTAEEIARGPFFARQRFHHARATRLQRMGQSTMAKPCPDGKRNLSRASPPDNAAHIPVRRVQASANPLR